MTKSCVQSTISPDDHRNIMPIGFRGSKDGIALRSLITIFLLSYLKGLFFNLKLSLTIIGLSHSTFPFDF